MDRLSFRIQQGHGKGAPDDNDEKTESEQGSYEVHHEACLGPQFAGNQVYSDMALLVIHMGDGKKENLLFRNGARVGEDLYVSGTLGDSALGLRMLREKGRKKKSKRLIQKHLSPIPRIELGQAIAKHRLATSSIDVSDGLLIDTGHLLEESGVGVRIWEGRIPLSRDYQKWIHTYSRDPFQIALRGGEDYELLFTAPPNMRKKISSLAFSLKIPITRIGEILPKKEGVSLLKTDGKEVYPKRLGFDHFK